MAYLDFSKMKTELVQRLDRAGLFMVSGIRQKLNRSQRYTRSGANFRGHDPSKPGEFPKKLSGQLIKSISHKVDADRLELTVGTKLPHGKYLQTGTRFMQPRPWLTKSWDGLKNET